MGHLVPKLDGPITVLGVEATDEVVLGCLDFPLGDIHMVVHWLHKLSSASLLLEVFFNGGS